MLGETPVTGMLFAFEYHGWCLWEYYELYSISGGFAVYADFARTKDFFGQDEKAMKSK